MDASLLGKKDVVQASSFICLINLMKNVLAAGTVSLPYGFYETSIIPGAILLAIVGVCSGYAFILLARCSLLSQCYSYNEIATKAYGARFSWWVDVTVLCYTIGSTISFIVVIGDWIPLVFEGWNAPGFFTARATAVVIFTIVFILPLAFLRNLEPLKFTSSIGLICLLFSCGLVIERGFKDGEGSNVKTLNFTPDLFRAIPLMTVAFAAHYSGPKLFKELGSDMTKWYKVIGWETILVLIVYLSTSIAGYHAWGDQIDGDIFDNYDSDDQPILWARLLLSMSVVFTIPFSFLSVRNHFAHVLYGMDNDSGYPLPRKIVITLSLLGISVLVGILVPNIELVIAFKGSLFGTPVIFVFPAMFYLKLLSDSHKKGVSLTSITNEGDDQVVSGDYQKIGDYGNEDDSNSVHRRSVQSNYRSMDKRGTCQVSACEELTMNDWIGPVLLMTFGIITGIISFIMTVINTING